MVIIYFSGTGNSKYIAEQFAERMNIKAYDIEQDLDFKMLLAEEDTIAVCYPIYGSGVPRIMREFVEKYESCFRTKKLIIFCTQMLFSGDGARAFSRLLPGCDERIIYAEHFLMPNNICNFFLFPITERERIKKPEKALKKLERVCSDIQRGIVKRRGWNIFSALLGKTQNITFPQIEMRGRSSFRTDENCVACGACVKNCPTHNLEIVSGNVVQKNNCTLCYRCVNLCPKQSCTVFLHGKPERQYRGVACDRENRKHMRQ
ncbi:MAG: EFR1 family ferrodoxin [Acetatifactor sp.]|nr:EFR1 family ferrodoxin [Acetatifactor sp.]